MAGIILQVTYLTSILFLSSQIVYNIKSSLLAMTGGGPHLSSSGMAALCIAIHVVPVAVLLIIWLLCLPLIMTKLTLVANIEMMKDP